MTYWQVFIVWVVGIGLVYKAANLPAIQRLIRPWHPYLEIFAYGWALYLLWRAIPVGRQFGFGVGVAYFVVTLFALFVAYTIGNQRRID